MKVRALKGAYKRILELDQKELAFEGFALGTPPGVPGDTDNANRWLCVSLSNKAQFSMHLEVTEF